MPLKAGNSAKAYRVLSNTGRPVAPNEPGTLRQQFEAIDLYLSAQVDERRFGSQAKRLWTVCHCLATGRPIHWELQK